jgi:hypothetical protein
MCTEYDINDGRYLLSMLEGDIMKRFNKLDVINLVITFVCCFLGIYGCFVGVSYNLIVILVKLYLGRKRKSRKEKSRLANGSFRPKNDLNGL